MKHIIIATTLALGMASIAIAQPSTDDRGERAEQYAQKRIDRMAEQLNLTPAQRVEVEAIFAAQAIERRELHQRHRSERKALMEASKARMSDVLSSEQQAQLEQMHAERRSQWQDKRGHRGPHDGQRQRRDRS